ncbi:hypothetical protein GJ744_000917 [Endocarpon pusillum]|uniref:Uncharacterized protein n=1 Tax=Endocarpon pusillum TaxID=364733 RepID=A0A8H7AT28_9EURO|nr:hypothetical protein GJ744_000917 [Endocarpon pusillum]
MLNNRNNNQYNDQKNNRVAVELETNDHPGLKLRGATDEPNLGQLSADQLKPWRADGYLVLEDHQDALPQATVSRLVSSVRETAETAMNEKVGVKAHIFVPEKDSYAGRIWASLGESSHSDPRITQSLIITKASAVGPKVVPHQDGCTGFTDPASCITFWYALEDATAKNGCLAVAPGSHQTEPIAKRCQKDNTGLSNFVQVGNPVSARLNGVDDSTLPKNSVYRTYRYKSSRSRPGRLC